MILPGWNCAECLTFNGEQKEPLHECRACGRPRKTFGLPLETMMRLLRLLEENVTATQRRCTEQEEELRAERERRERAERAWSAENDELIETRTLLGEHVALFKRVLEVGDEVWRAIDGYDLQHDAWDEVSEAGRALLAETKTTGPEETSRIDLTREEMRGVFMVIHHWKSLFEAGTLHPQDAAYKKAFEVNERLEILLGISSG